MRSHSKVWLVASIASACVAVAAWGADSRAINQAFPAALYSSNNEDAPNSRPLSDGRSVNLRVRKLRLTPRDTVRTTTSCSVC
jgi:hypothetical protein